MRRYFFARHYETKDAKWLAMAISKKRKLVVKIPKRQYVGATKRTQKTVDEAVERRLKSLDLVGAVKAKITTSK